MIKVLTVTTGSLLVFVFSREPLDQEMISNSGCELQEYLQRQQDSVEFSGFSYQTMRVPLNLTLEDFADADSAELTSIDEIMSYPEDYYEALQSILVPEKTSGDQSIVILLNYKKIYLSVIEFETEIDLGDTERQECAFSRNKEARLLISEPVNAFKMLRTMSLQERLEDGRYLELYTSYKRPAWTTGKIPQLFNDLFDPSEIRFLIDSDGDCIGLQYKLESVDFELLEEAGGTCCTREYYVLNGKVYESREELQEALDASQIINCN